MTQAKTQSMDSSDNKNTAARRERRVEDEIRLRELELQTNFRVETLTESLNLLKNEFHSWRDSLNERLIMVGNEVDSLKTRLTIVIALLIGQMIGAPAAFNKLLGI